MQTNKNFEVIDFDFQEKFTPLKWSIGFEYCGHEFVLHGGYKDNKLVSKIFGRIPEQQFQEMFEKVMELLHEEPVSLSSVYELLREARPTKIVNYMQSGNAPVVSESVWSYQELSEIEFLRKSLDSVIAISLIDCIRI